MQKSASLPDLIDGRGGRPRSANSLTEGFPAFKRPACLMFSPPKVKMPGHPDAASAELIKVLPIYYRVRQLVLSTEKGGHRVPQKLSAELHKLEQIVEHSLRPLNPLLFQRFDDMQLDRFLRSTPFLRLSEGRWVFGSDSLEANWPASGSQRCFLLLYGSIGLFSDPSGAGAYQRIYPGCIFGQEKLSLGDEGFHDEVAGAARCEEPCMLGVLTGEVLETAFADRAISNRRIAQVAGRTRPLDRLFRDKDQELPDVRSSKHSRTVSHSSGAKRTGVTASSISAQLALQGRFKIPTEGRMWDNLSELAKVASILHVKSDEDVLTEQGLEKSLLIVSKGRLEIRGDCLLQERLDSIPPKRVRIRVKIERAERLAGDSIFDKLDPYVIAKLGDFKRLQTPVLNNAGVNPQWDYNGVLGYGDEKFLEFQVNDYDKYSSDDPCGHGSIAISELHDGWSGFVQLMQPKKVYF